MLKYFTGGLNYEIKEKNLSMLLLSAVLLTGCGSTGNSSDEQSESKSDDSDIGVSTAVSETVERENGIKTDFTDIVTQLDKINMTKWQYNEENNVYWQCGIPYCENPADESYENLGIYIPVAYMNAAKNDDGSYTCENNILGEDFPTLEAETSTILTGSTAAKIKA